MNKPDQVLNDITARYLLVLGAAAADLWSELPPDLQHTLFERAVVLGHQREEEPIGGRSVAPRPVAVPAE